MARKNSHFLTIYRKMLRIIYLDNKPINQVIMITYNKLMQILLYSTTRLVIRWPNRLYFCLRLFAVFYTLFFISLYPLFFFGRNVLRIELKNSFHQCNARDTT